MKHCAKCGKELFDEAVVCPECGCATGEALHSGMTNNTSDKRGLRESAGLANTSLAFAFLVPIVGFILGLIGVSTYKTKIYKGQSKAAIFISVAVEIVLCITVAVLIKYYS